MVLDARRLAKAEAPSVERQLAEAARVSLNEAEFRGKAAEIFQKFADSAGVALRRHDEYAVASGRADTVYNRLVIEYKAPGKLTAARSTFNARAIKKITEYIADIATKEHHHVSRMAGIIIDGRRAIFLRFYEKVRVVDPPVELSPEVVERLLNYLASLAAGVALIPENLLRDFAPDNPATRMTVKALYDTISESREGTLTDQLFLQWQIFFEEISGYESGSSKFSSKRELRSFVTKLGLSPTKVDPPKLLFSVHTYFALIIKLIAWLAISKHLTKVGMSFAQLATFSSDRLKDELAKLERGGLFRELGIRNLLEGDFFGWYLDSWNSDIREAVKLVLERLADYDPGTLELNPEATRDLLKKLYHYLLPRELRHDLGEYYTPDWLAELVLNRLEGIEAFSGNPDLRILDPACGSGTFLLMAIKAVRETARRELLDERATLHKILSNIVGIDLNPLAVIASRTNYLLAIQDLLEYRSSEIDIPVYLADSILIPSMTSDIGSFGKYRIKTGVGVFELSSHVTTRERIDILANLLDDAVSAGISSSAFLTRAKEGMRLSEGELSESKDSLIETFEKIDRLHRSGLDGLWARIVKNAFAPLFVGQFDFIAGNPPWINWQSLPRDYRTDTKKLWERYGLFPHGGMDTILGKGKKDISMLMTYVVIDKFLKPLARLGFVITQSVFKTSGSGQGFRRFRLPDGGDIKVVHVDDMADLNPFEGAKNRTAVMVLAKGARTTYPTPYTLWRKTETGKSIPFEASLEQVEDLTAAEKLDALPVDGHDPTSPWLTVPHELTSTLGKVIGDSAYMAREGSNTGGANGVYWVQIVKRRPDGAIVVRNMTEGARREVEQVEAAVEPDLLYPLLRGRNVSRWRAGPSGHILLAQDPATRSGLDLHRMQTEFPKTYAYFKKFERPLRDRPLYRRYFKKGGRIGRSADSGPFYSMFGVGDYTLTPWKLVWREQAGSLTAAVVGPVDKKPVVPDHKLMLVACTAASEAHYLCAVLNSAPVRMLVKGFAVSIQMGPQVITRLRVPKWLASDSVHASLSKASLEAHSLAKDGDSAAVRKLEERIDREAAGIWGISYPELQDIWRVLRS